MNEEWPPGIGLDQEKVLELLTGERFYSNSSAALREAILNAIDAVHRRRQDTAELIPRIDVAFDSERLTFAVNDNGIGMNKGEVKNLFLKVGASAAADEARKESVGEFGIGVISYFMAGDKFTLQTFDGESEPIGLMFEREMLAGRVAEEITAERTIQGTTVQIQVRDKSTYDLLKEKFAYWCHDVEGLTTKLLPQGEHLEQRGTSESIALPGVQQPQWVERARLHPVSEPTGWDAMTGHSIIAVLYRGVFVQNVEVEGLWGIEGSIDVDPKYFKPRLNRESFVEGEFQSEVAEYMGKCHPVILSAMAGQLKDALESGILSKWTVNRWANLWLALPRGETYGNATKLWDEIFRSIPAFELAAGNQWKPASLDQIKDFRPKIYLAPLTNENPTDVVQAALRLLRNTGRPVIRGVRRDRSWLRYASRSFHTTADLISTVFAAELPPLVPIAQEAEQILGEIEPVAQLYAGPPTVDLVRIGADSLPVLRLADRLIVNLDQQAGRELVEEVLRQNTGPISLVTSAARNAYEQLTQVAAVVRDIKAPPEILGPIRCQFIRSLLS